MASTAVLLSWRVAVQVQYLSSSLSPFAAWLIAWFCSSSCLCVYQCCARRLEWQ